MINQVQKQAKSSFYILSCRMILRSLVFKFKFAEIIQTL